MVCKTCRNMMLDFMYHKSVRRLLKKLANFMKMSAIVLSVMMISGFIHAVFDQSVSQDHRNTGIRQDILLLRHQRQVNDVHRSSKVFKMSQNLSKRLENSKNLNNVQQYMNNFEKAREIPFVSTWPKTLEPIEPVALGYVPLYMAVDYDVIRKRAFVEKELEIRMKWSNRIRSKRFSTMAPNPSFIFHNKLPKSGSSTMNNILKRLSKENSFNFVKMETSDFQTSDDAYLVKELKSKMREPFFLLKHHRFFNFTTSDQIQPTYINVMRDPLEWFTSRYYFTRFGWKRKPGCRKADCGMSKEERLMDIDECVQKKHRECMNPWMYIQFFCGTSPACFNVTSLEQKEKATEIAKQNILDEYYVVGVLEHFEETLKLFEVMLPKYFKNAVRTWKSDFIQQKQSMTKTTYKKEMSKDSRDFFRYGPLHYEIELYNFALEVFKQKLQHFDIQSTA